MKGGIDTTRRLLIAAGLLVSVVVGYFVGSLAGGGSGSDIIPAPTAVATPVTDPGVAFTVAIGSE